MNIHSHQTFVQWYIILIVDAYTIAYVWCLYLIHVSGWNFDPKPKFRSETQITIWNQNFDPKPSSI